MPDTDSAARDRAITISSNATRADANAGDGAADADSLSNAPLLPKATTSFVFYLSSTLLP